MRVFVAGGTGALGRRLVPLLVAAGHQVTVMARSNRSADAVKAFGAEPVFADALDAAAVRRTVSAAKPEVVIHQATALSSMKSLRSFDSHFAVTNRLRTEGTDNLLEAALAAGARRFIAQSYTGWPNPRTGGPVKDESAGFDPDPPAAQRQSLAAIAHLEKVVVGARAIEGLALRYGNFYGPSTGIASEGEIVKLVRKRRFPVVGGGAGVWSHIHIDDAARATVLALTAGAPGVYNIVDDEPAPVATWLPELARIVGAPPPRHVPAWVGRLFIGSAGVSMMTRARGSSNAHAKAALGFAPEHATWRTGFVSATGRRTE